MVLSLGVSMDPAMFASLHDKEQVPQKITKLPDFLKEGFEYLFTEILKEAKEDYTDSLMSFSQYAEKLHAQAEEVYLEDYKTLCHAQDLLREKFLLEEEDDPDMEADAKFSVWEEISQSIKKNMPNKLKTSELDDEEIAANLAPLQEYLGIPWPFMDRAYQYATELLKRHDYEDANDIYHFLRHLNPDVFEYWFGEALCQQLLGNYEDAIASYIESLYLRPTTPLVFYQMACCYYGLEKKENAKAALEVCIEHAKEQEGSEAIQLQATELLQKL
jgi:tetratricopeptide (TPR) repeat protein